MLRINYGFLHWPKRTSGIDPCPSLRTESCSTP